jgi:hypothetical protein
MVNHTLKFNGIVNYAESRFDRHMLAAIQTQCMRSHTGRKRPFFFRLTGAVGHARSADAKAQQRNMAF